MNEGEVCVTRMMFSDRLTPHGNIRVAKYLVYSSIQQTLTKHLLCTRYTTLLDTAEGTKSPVKDGTARADGNLANGTCTFQTEPKECPENQ